MRSTYVESAPPPRLASVVSCLWTQRVDDSDATDATDVFVQPVLPDACLDLVINDERVVVAGPATMPTVARLAPGSVTVGVRFRTGAAPAALGVAASELRDLTVSLADVWGAPAAELDDRCATAAPAERLELLAAAVATRLTARSDVDRVAVDVAAMIAERPDHPVPRLAATVGLSDRQLRRRIEDAVGYSPRTLARISRFQRFLAAARATDTARRDLAELAARSGYADQAHLSRESRRLAGQPPGRLLAAEDRRLARESSPRPNRSRHGAAA